MKITIPTQLPAFPAFRKNRSWAFTLIELLVVISIIAILAGIALPVFTSVQTKGAQAKDLSNARQVGLGLRLYASDNNGYFPTTNPTTSGTAVTANDAFLNIVPTYIPSQKIFWLAGSQWSTGSHATELGTSGTLASGQNNYAYVSGLLDSSNTNFPLVADGFAGALGTSSALANGAAVYTSNATAPGGVWKGTKAIVVHVDDSAAIDAVSAASGYKVYENGANPKNLDIFDCSDTTGAWMSSSQAVLNPF